MAALVCEICGGKLMAKSGGLFECEYCGMQYDKTRIQEMVQEIKGTVKVEGTVAVTGTVAVDHKTNIDNLLKRIAICAKDSNFQKVPVLIEELLKLDPECGAAYLWQVAAKFDCCSLEDIFEQHLDTLEKIVQSSEWENALQYSDEQESDALRQRMEDSIQYWKAPNPNLKKRFNEIQPMQDLIHNCGTAIIGLRADGTVRVTCSQKDSWIRPIEKWTGIKKILTDNIYCYVIGLKWNGTVVVVCKDSKECRAVQDVQRWAKDVIEITAAGAFVACLDSSGVLDCSLNEFENENDDDVFYFGYSEDWNDVTELKILRVAEHGVRGTFWGRELYGIEAYMVLGITKSGSVKCSASSYDLGDASIEKAIGANYWERQRNVLKIGDVHGHVLYRDGSVYEYGFLHKDKKRLDFNISDTGCIIDGDDFMERDLVAECDCFALRADGTVLRGKRRKRNKSELEDAKPDHWTNLVALEFAYVEEHWAIIGLREDGTVLIAWSGEPHPDICVDDWRLFESAKTFLQEREEAQKQQQEEARKKQEEARKKQEEKERIAREKQQAEERIQFQRRQSGLCQHCGGELKGLFFKKCVSCGKPKDY